jgi:hypothetical protein
MTMTYSDALAREMNWKKNGSHGNAFASVACAYIIRGAALDPKS